LIFDANGASPPNHRLIVAVSAATMLVRYLWPQGRAEWPPHLSAIAEMTAEKRFAKGKRQ